MKTLIKISIKLVALLLFTTLNTYAQRIPIHKDSVVMTTFTPDSSLFSISTGTQQYCDTCTKEVYLIHGLAGNINSWKNVNEAIENGYGIDFPARKVSRAKNLAYDDPNSANSLYLMASRVNDQVSSYQSNNGTSGPDNTILIAHSQGGLVIRELNYRNATQTGASDLHTRRTGSSITFGTPHQGARILNNIDPNGPKMAEVFINEACKKLGNAEVLNAVKDFWPAIFISTDYLKSITNSACDALIPTSINLMFKDMMIPATAEYRVGASKINELNNFNQTVPFLLFYGEEESPIFWRTMASFTFEYPLATLVDPFGLDDDQQGVVKFNDLRNRYLTRQNEASDRAKHFHRKYLFYLSAWYIPGNYIIAYNSNKNKQKWMSIENSNKDARQFVENANERWERIIGARTSTRVQDGYICMCYKEVSNEPMNSFEELLIRLNQMQLSITYMPTAEGNCSKPGFTCTVIPRYHMPNHVKPNDGVVLSESAGTLNGAVNSIMMERTNHQQMRNCTETKIGLNDAFNGEHGPEFYIQPK